MNKQEQYARRLKVMESIRNKITKIDTEEAADMLDAVCISLGNCLDTENRLTHAKTHKKIILDMLTVLIPCVYGTDMYKQLQETIINYCEECKL